MIEAGPGGKLMLKTRILTVALSVILIMVAILGGASFVLRENAERLYRPILQQGSQHLLMNIIANVLFKMEINATAVTRNAELIAAIPERNGDAAASASIGIFNRLSTGQVIDAFMVADLQGNVMVAHGGGTQKGPLRSALLQSVIASGQFAQGLEGGVDEVPVVRYVIPLLQRGAMVGVAVLQKGFAGIQQEVAAASHAEAALLDPQAKVVVSTHPELFAGLLRTTALGEAGYHNASTQTARYGLIAVPLKDSEGKPLGLFVSATDHTDIHLRDARTSWLAGAVVLAVLALSILALWRYVGRAFEPLERLVELMRRVQESGDFSLRTSVAAGDDEVAQASRSFNQVISRLGEVIRQVQQSSDDIATAAQKMAASGAQVSGGAATQAAAAEHAAASMEQTAASISGISRHAVAANAVADLARQGIEAAQHAMKETLASVETVAGMIRGAGENVVRLDNSSRRIGGIVQVIKEIADQTNLLALNAAIEAARAGEQGRGFAVVADEVRKLAESTTQATNEIASLIGSVQAEVKAAVAEMHEANTHAERGFALVVQTEATLSNVGCESAQAADKMCSIADAVGEQSAAVQQVSASIEHMACIADTNRTLAGEAEGLAHSLGALAGRLHCLVGDFRTA